MGALQQTGPQDSNAFRNWYAKIAGMLHLRPLPSQQGPTALPQAYQRAQPLLAPPVRPGAPGTAQNFGPQGGPQTDVPENDVENQHPPNFSYPTVQDPYRGMPPGLQMNPAIMDLLKSMRPGGA